MNWQPTQTPSYLQAQQEVIDELMKEVKGLRHLKEENVRLIEESVELIKEDKKKQNLLSESHKCIEQLQAEIKEAKSAHCKTFMEAKLQINLNDYKKWAEQRDEYKHQLNAANKEIEKLKSDIVDYVIEKDDELNELKKAQDWKELSAREQKRYFVCNHCSYKVAHDTNYYGGCGFCKEGLMIEKTEEQEQKHPMYPIHWGGWDKVETTTISKQEEWQCPCNKCKDKREDKAEKTWEEAAADLALRVVKLEKKVEELTLITYQNPYSYKNPDGAFKNAIPCNISTSVNNPNIKGTI